MEDTPDKLHDTVLFILGINLALRAGDKHHDLCRDAPNVPSQLSFEHDTESGKRCVVYKEETVTKCNDGGINSLKKESKVVWIFLTENVNRCPVRLIDKYISLCPEVMSKTKKPNFYLRSLENPNPVQWYSCQPVGRNTLSKVVGKLLKSCNLDGYFMNHSLHRTSATRLFQTGIDQKIVKEITGHASDALEKYQVTSKKQREHVSKILSQAQNECEQDHETVMEVTKPITPSLELSVLNASKGNIAQYQCSCKKERFNLGQSEQIPSMINELVSNRSGSAKIKTEIEFGD